MINLTQHKATEEQKNAGVIDLPDDLHEKVKMLIDFKHCPTVAEMRCRARKVVDLIINHDYTVKSALIGGAPFFMSTLENALLSGDIIPYYSFSIRDSVEEVKDGVVIKVNKFVHKEFVQVR